MPAAGLLALALLIASGHAWAQDSIDDLLSLAEDTEDTEGVEGTEVDESHDASEASQDEDVSPGNDLAPVPGDNPAPVPGNDPAPVPGDDSASFPGDDMGDDPAPVPSEDAGNHAAPVPSNDMGDDPAPVPGDDMGDESSQIDALFADPEEGIIDEAPTETVDVDALTAEDAPLLSGSASAEAAVSVGLTTWEPVGTLRERIDFAASYGMSATIALDARPSSTTRFYTWIGASAPSPDSVLFSGFSIGELFLDYTLLGSVFFRVGKQSLTWGAGRLFNPTNLVSSLAETLSLRATTAGRAGEFAAIVMAGDGFFADPTLPRPDEVRVVGRWGWNLSPFAGTVAGSFRGADGPGVDGLRTSASVYAPLLGADLVLEGVVAWGEGWAVDRYDILVSFFRPFGVLGLNFQLEYLVASPHISSGGFGSTAGVAVFATELLPRWNPGVRWLHAFYDGSGEVVVGVEGPVADHLRLGVALPFTYGPQGGYYRLNSEDPFGRVAAAVVQLTLQVDF